jgi:hypothetical protein
MRWPLIVAMSMFGCGGGSSPDLEDRDPRCVSACTDDPPSVDGAGDICNTGSQANCLDECELRIAGVPTVCASCLLEDACFDPDGCGPISEPVFCEGTPGDETCTVTGRNGSCTFPAGDDAAADDCERQVNPRREVACTAEFRSTSECNVECD